jgi:3'-phosphoadenosine 5'-phosphosulfate sulfotransferase (PAPS reductase)/FAD synthetase
VFVNTGLEYAEIVKFVRSIPNVDIIRPKLTYKEVIEKYGYPIISKDTSGKIDEIRNTKSEHLRDIRLGKTNSKPGKLSNKWKFLIDAPFKISNRCCDILKKSPLLKYEHENGLFPYVGTMAEESNLRQQSYCIHSCNAFNMKDPQSRPLMFWSKNDVLQYLRDYNVDYCKNIYGDIVENNITGELTTTRAKRTGCTFCMFGVHLEKYPNRFQRMQIEQPALYDYCINKLNLKEPLEYCHIPYDKDDFGNGIQTSIDFDLED